MIAQANIARIQFAASPPRAAISAGQSGNACWSAHLFNPPRPVGNVAFNPNFRKGHFPGEPGAGYQLHRESSQVMRS